MSEFTYELPDNKSFFNTVTTILKSDPKYAGYKYYDIVKDGYCEISDSSKFSGKRWNAMYTSVNFYISQNAYAEHASNIPAIKDVLLKVCRMVMPPNAGYDIMEINISPNLHIGGNSDVLNEVIESVNQTKLDILSDDIKQKGKEMSELYVTLYCIENSLRNFIDKTLSEILGENYFSQLSVPGDISKGIATRKKDEAQNKWLPLRGDKDIYYLDFIDLSKLILNNWEYFKKYFPTQGWISTKIEELYKVRCLIAHNSYAGEDEKELVSLYYKQIIKQIASV